MIELVLAVALSCMLSDTPARVTAWLLSQDMQPAATAYSKRFRREIAVWRDSAGRYKIVVPYGVNLCVLDAGVNWQWH